jgi:hypothetical protein
MIQEQARQPAQENSALQRRAEVAEARALELQREVRERGAAVGRMEKRIVGFLRHQGEREAAVAALHCLQRQVDTAEERVRELALQQDARILHVHPVAQALSGGVCTASYAELAAATRNFAVGNILGRGGFGPVYLGEWGGQAVAIKRLDQASLSK